MRQLYSNNIFIIVLVESSLSFFDFFFTLIFSLSIFLINYLKNEFREIDSKEIVIDEYLGQSVPILLFYILLYEGDFSLNFFQFLLSCLLLVFVF